MSDSHNNLIRDYHLVEIPGGSFIMGDACGDGFKQERPTHEVYLDSFMAAKYCVTVKEYFDFISDIGSDFQELWCDFIDPCFIINEGGRYRMCDGADNYPMIQVSFVGAIAYCNWCSERNGLQSVYNIETLEDDLSRDGFRLLKESEWEYACGGLKGLKYSLGNTLYPDKINYINFSGKYREFLAGHNKIGGFGLYDYSPVPVGTLPPNDFGLYEMLGNVNEWCHDRYAPYSGKTEKNPSGSEEGSFRVIRGGCFMDDADKIRKSCRHAIHPEAKCMIDGFRIAKNK